ncbi:MAG: PTS sugar transporter subunit IIA [Thermodesulfobacteriota bacterium]|nr:PTS sugar transporter subunit IIA [Thermodesulfobacteriota bacterium]
MKLSEIIAEDNVLPELKSVDKRGVLEELAGVISNHEPSIDQGALVSVLLERERLGTTGIGDGVAIPHGKLSGIRRPIISFGRSKNGLDFDSIDGEPAHLFCLLIAPENSSGVHLQVLARIAKVLKSSALRKKLMGADTRKELYQVIIQGDEAS